MTSKEQMLIQRYIDGELSSKEKLAAENLINNNGEAKKYHEDIISIDNALDEGAKSQVEIDLKERIMNEILRKEKTRESTIKAGSVFDRIFPNLRWNIAYAFVMGIIIGAIVVVLVPKQESVDDIPNSLLSGTISNNISGDLFSLPVDLPGLHLNINADKLQENYFKVLVEVMTEEAGMVNLSFNRSGFYMQSIQMLKQNNDCRIISNRSSVQFYNKGENTYILLMKKLSYLPEDINIQVYQEEAVKYENVVTLN